jgi:molybdenum cofactor biosynthesis protein B
MDSVEKHRSQAPEGLGFAVLTASDSRTEETDASGRSIADMATAAGHKILTHSIMPDKVEAIRTALQQALSVEGVDVVVVNGGTGLSPRDVTLEALAPLFERPVPGFGELFRMLSWQQVGAAAMLSRAEAAVIGRRLVFVVPGSPKAVELAMESLILPEAAHLLGLVRQA